MYIERTNERTNEKRNKAHQKMMMMMRKKYQARNIQKIWENEQSSEDAHLGREEQKC